MPEPVLLTYRRTVPLTYAFITENANGRANTTCEGNWSKTKAHTVRIYSNYPSGTEQEVGWVAAHEFGHCIGLTDFYMLSEDRQNQFYDSITGFSSIMDDDFDNGYVNASKYDVIKSLIALLSNKKEDW